MALEQQVTRNMDSIELLKSNFAEHKVISHVAMSRYESKIDGIEEKLDTVLKRFDNVISRLEKIETHNEINEEKQKNKVLWIFGNQDTWKAIVLRVLAFIPVTYGVHESAKNEASPEQKKLLQEQKQLIDEQTQMIQAMIDKKLK